MMSKYMSKDDDDANVSDKLSVSQMLNLPYDTMNLAGPTLQKCRLNQILHSFISQESWLHFIDLCWKSF